MISPSSPLEWLIAAAAFIVAIGVLVAVHEFGHYWVARRLGIKVLRFSIGFGKPLWRRVGNDPDQVEYVVAAIPLGGYVKLLDEREGNVPPAELPRAFTRQPVWKRIAVLLAGPMCRQAHRDPGSCDAGHSRGPHRRRHDSHARARCGW